MLIRRLLVQSNELKVRRALFTVSDKAGAVELARALHATGTEIVATGKTAVILKEAGLPVTPIEKVSGSPEAFQGRMKTLSFPVCSGILYRRGDESDEADLKKLSIVPIDCVVVNFYPFEQAAAREGISRKELIEEIDIGGPTLVRAAAKNAPDVLVLTNPQQYTAVISDLSSKGSVGSALVDRCASEAWDRINQYDSAISERMGSAGVSGSKRVLRYGENPHQKGHLEFDPSGPIAWDQQLTPSELSYNNILDLSAAYALASDLKEIGGSHSTSVVIVKHNNPCGVALIAREQGGVSLADAQLSALQRAWEGDPVSAFGGVLVFTDEIQEKVAVWLAERFVELVSAPGLSKQALALNILLSKRRNLKAVSIHQFGKVPATTTVTVPGGRLIQTSDTGLNEELKSMTRVKWPQNKAALSRFGMAVCRALKSNAIALVREIPGHEGSYQLVGAGQGQPNRIEALKALAVPRARSVLEATGGEIGDCVMVSDAFFPFRDTVETSHEAGIRYIIQPGGSIKDNESIAACDEFGISMAFTGVRHFRH
jgi:phosphoribosylaminoimidazolecarboxamide formyltransferase / IMP cyclohydrolase